MQIRTEPDRAFPRDVAPRSAAATIAFAWGAMLISYLPFSAVNGVLAHIGAAVHASTADLQWVTDAFTVALIAAVLAGGRLGDRLGRRRVTLIGLGLTIACSTIGLIAGILSTGPAAAATIPLLWIGQGIGGIGGGLVMSATLPLIAISASTPAVRDRSIAVWAAANVTGLGAGPFIAGLATAVAGWPSLFVATGALALVALIAGGLVARESRSPARPTLDTGGLATGAAGAVLLVFGVIAGGSRGWTDVASLASLAAGIALLVAFVALEMRVPHPIIDPRLFASRAFSAAGIAAAVALFAMVGLVFVVSVSLGRAGVRPWGIAVLLGCLFAGNAVASVLTGPLLARVPARLVLTGGLLIAAAGSAALLTVTDVSSAPGMAWRLTVIGIGGGFTVATAAALAVRSVPPQQAGMAGVANNTLRQLGGALGPAVLGSVFALSAGAGSAPAALAAGLHAAALPLTIVIIIASAVSAVLMATTTEKSTS